MPAEPKVSAEQKAALERVFLLFQAERDEIDAAFQERMASQSLGLEEWLATLEAFCLERFDLNCRWLRPLVGHVSVEAQRLEGWLAQSERWVLDFVARVMGSAKPEYREPFLGRLGMKLNARTLALLAEDKRKRFEKLPRPRLDRLHVGAAVISKRKRIIREYCREYGLLFPDFARRFHMSETAIRGIVKEDRTRFAEDKRNQLIEKLGVSLDDWYRP